MLEVFDILEPSTLEEASSILETYGFDASIYAGGTELLLLMKEGLVHYPHLINIKTIPGLNEISLVDDGQALSIGPLVTHRELERSPLVREHAPLLAEVESMVANIRVRAAGTLGGNLCFAEPHSDPATLILATGGALELSRAAGKREVPVDSFFLDLFTVNRQPEEILTGIRVPVLPPQAAGAYERFTVHERPTASVAAVLWVNRDRIQKARLSVGCVGPVPHRIKEAEDILTGESPSTEVFDATAQLVARGIDPVGDIYGSEGYKRNLVRKLCLRALSTAAARVDGGEADHG